MVIIVGNISQMRLFVFYIAIISLGKVWTYLREKLVDEKNHKDHLYIMVL